jgi:hypothetical protein
MLNKLSIYKVPSSSRAWFSPKSVGGYQVVAIFPKYGKCVFTGSKAKCKQFIKETKGEE